MTHRPVLYASAGWGVHDQRWVAALEACGFAVRVFSDPIPDVALIRDAEPRHAPVLAGPLTTVARPLVGMGRPVVGLSWGFDLQRNHSQAVDPADLAWVTALDRLIVDSPSTRAIALDLGVPETAIHLIPWGIELEAFTPEGAVADFGFPAGARVVLSLRTQDDLYRTVDVVEAFGIAARRDPSLCLVMGGAGPLSAQHAARLAELGLTERVRFTGQVPETQIASLLRSADLYVTASETDGTSVTLLQAMACAVPVVASDNAGNDWWIRPGDTGHRFAVGDVVGLADLMLSVTRSDGCPERARQEVLARADWTTNRLALREIMTFGEPS